MSAEPRVQLLSWTRFPVETLGAVWQASRDNEPVAEPMVRPPDNELFRKIIQSKIPVSQMIDFVFLLHDVSISFREQMVRHKIGVKVGDRIGSDLAPDLSDSAWWSQSMRVLDMGTFAFDRAYYAPPSIKNKNAATTLLDRAMLDAQIAYNKLVGMGIPREDARQVIPLGSTHRIVWKLNLSALMHIIGHRACWILQLGFWRPVIEGMIRELCEKVDPVFRDLATPPCLKDEKFAGCLFRLDNEKRLLHEDPLPPCPLWFSHNKGTAAQLLADPGVQTPCKVNRDTGALEFATSEKERTFRRMFTEYYSFWQRDPWNGERTEREA